VKKGTEVKLSAVGSEIRTEGIISYVTRVMDDRTENYGKCSTLNSICLAPGTFVNAHVEAGEGVGLVVDRKQFRSLIMRVWYYLTRA
jgi:hypothetical protein